MTTGDSRKYYNYIYCDPRNMTPYKIKGVDIILPAEPFYVGMGQGSRMYDHLRKSQRVSDYKGSSNNHKINKINKILSIELDPIIVKVSSKLTKAEANQQERFLIKVIGRNDLGLGTLTNLNDGGEGSQNVSGETRKKQSLAKKGKKNPKLSKYLKGRPLLDETKRKMSEKRRGENNSNYGIKTTEEKILKIINSQPKRVGVYQISKEDNSVVKFWISQTSLIKERGVRFRKNVLARDMNGFFWVKEPYWVNNKITCEIKEKVNPNFGKTTPLERKERILRSQPNRKQVIQANLDYTLVKIWLSEKKLKRDTGLNMTKRKADVVEKDGFLWIKETEWLKILNKK